MVTPQRLLRAATFCTVIGLLATGARAEDDVDVRLKAFSEVPSVSSKAKGRFRADLDTKGGKIDYTLSYSGLQGSVTQAHIHFGQAGVNGGVSVYLCQTGSFVDPTGLAPACPTSGSVSGRLTANNVIGPATQGIDAGQFSELVAAIRGGVAYVNVHSSKFPLGEIRGQLRED